MAANKFYPALSTLMPLDKIPDSIGFAREGLQNLFGHFFYKDLQIQKSAAGEIAFYKLTIISYKKVGIEIPGCDGVSLLLNPSFAEGNSSEFLISLSYQWGILKYIKGFQIETFNWDARAFFDMLVEIAGVNVHDLLSQSIEEFIIDDEDHDPIQKFVDDFNAKYAPVTALVKSPNPDITVVIEDLLSQLQANGNSFDPQSIIFDFFVGSSSSIMEAAGSIEALFYKWLGLFTFKDIESLTVPKASLSLDNISIGIEFPRSIFIPIDTEEDLDSDPATTPGSPLPETYKSLLTFNVGSLQYSTESGFAFSGESSINFTKSQIGNTGLTLEFDNMKLDLSKTSSIPEVAAAGYATDFVGVFIERAVIGLPPSLFKNNTESANTAEIIGSNLLIGTGGFSGTIALETDGSPFSAKIGNIIVNLEAFDVVFKQNAIISSSINGTLSIPGFKDAEGNDALLNIDVHIGTNGDFNITAKEKEGVVIRVPNVFDFTVKSASVGRKDGLFFIAVSGAIEFDAQPGFLGKFLPSAIDIKKLIVWEDGTLEFEGGHFPLPKAIPLKVGPADISITGIHLGTHEQNLNGVKRKYRYFGFDGGISINPGGVDARGDGVKFYYTIDSGSLHTFVRIDSIAIDLVIPSGASKDQAAVLVSGYLSFKQPEGADPDAGKEYTGGVTITLPKPGITGSAAMRYNPKVPAFLVDVSLEFPAPIPIFPPVGIYGFRGLFGRRYVASREHIGLAPDASWYLYYKKKVFPENREGIFPSKFDTSKDGFSLGVGASIATMGDNGHAFSSKVFLMLSLPDVMLIQGQAQMLKQRLGLDTTSDPPFSAIISISKTAIEATFGVNYKVPDDGSILKVDAVAEMAFFKNNPSGWYINIGRDLPESKRVTAKVLSLFNMYSYLMLSSQGMRMGAGVNYELKKEFGPLKLELRAYLDLMAKVNVKPLQLGGAIYLGGYARLKIFKFKFDVSVDAGLAVEAPKPFIVSGKIEVCVRILRKNRCAHIDFTHTFNTVLDTSEVVFLDNANITAINIATGEAFPLNTTASSSATPPALSQWSRNFDKHIIPMDSHIDFEFSKGIGLGSAISDIGKAAQAYTNFELIPPQKGKSPQVLHTYTVEEVKVWSLVNGTNNQWKPYKIYEALTPLQDAQFIDNATLANLKAGWLQLDSDGKYKRLRMLSLSPLSYVNQGVDISTFTLEDLGLKEQDLFCLPEKVENSVFNYESVAVETTVEAGRMQSFTNMLIRVTVPQTSSPSPLVVAAQNPFGMNKGLLLSPGDEFEMIFKKPMAFVELKTTTASEFITVSYYKNEQQGLSHSRQPIYAYVLIKTETYQPSALTESIIYENADAPVSRIVIISGQCSIPPGDGGEDGGGEDGGGDDGTGDGNEDPCDCTCCQSKCKCCGGTATVTIPTSDGNEVDNLLNTYQQSLDKLEKVSASAALLQKEISMNTISENRLMNAQTASPEQENDNRLQAARFRFKKLEAEKEVSKVQAKLASLEDFTSAIKPLADLVSSKGNADQEVVALAATLFNKIEGQAYDFACKTLFFEVEYLSLEDHVKNQAVPSTEEVIFDLSSVTDGYSRTIHPLWRPDTTYAISIKTKDKVTVSEKTSANTTHDRYFHVGFRTKGPVGHFHTFVDRYNELKALDKEDEFQLASLKPYIDFGRSFPNADGRLVNAKPMFYGAPKLYVFYKQAYVYNMYNTFGAYNDNTENQCSLKVLIKDPAEPADTDTSLIIEQTGVGFTANTISVKQPDTTFFNNLTRGSNCVQVVPINPIGINTEVDPGELKPSKLYTALFLARYNGADAEVHRFVFQTSRYRNFEEQINSFAFKNDTGEITGNALYDNVEQLLSPVTLAKAVQVLSGTFPETDPLVAVHQDKYDLLMNGILQIPSLAPAIATEINLVRNSDDDSIIGFLVRSPEPLNDPKMPSDILATSLQVSFNSGPATEYKSVFSKDNANVFISNAGLLLSAGNYSFTFKYLQYNGSQYQLLESATLTIIVN